MSLTCQQHLFSLDENVHYLNNAYKAPLLKASEEAAVKALHQDRNPFLIGVEEYFRDPQLVKEEFGQLVNCAWENVAIIPSSSYGFASVLNNVKGKENGKAITIKDEFPSGHLALVKWCEKNNNELQVVDHDAGLKKVGSNWNEKILDAIDDRTTLVLMSSVHWMNGLKFDLKKIGAKCKSVGAIFIVDGTQSVGADPIDVVECNIDALICAAYKWLMGPYSTGLAFYGKYFEGGTPIEESWMNRSNAKDFSGLTSYEKNYHPKSGKFNVGETSNFILMPMLLSSLKQINAWGAENIQAYCENLIKPLKKYLASLEVELEDEAYFSNHLFSLQLPPSIDMELLKENLAKNKIFISLRGAFLRVSVNVFNDAKDIEKLVSVIEETRNFND